MSCEHRAHDHHVWHVYVVLCLSFWQVISITVQSYSYGGFLKRGYPQIIYVYYDFHGFSTTHHPVWGTPMTMETLI